MKWVILGINALFVIWIVTGIASGGSTDCGTLSVKDCQTAQAVGTGIGVFVIVALWAFVDVILGVVYLVTRKRA
jgi:hypothetical protein